MHKDVKTYIESHSNNIQEILIRVRQTILLAVPSADESVAYNMPAYKLNNKPLIYFAAFKHHLGIYATPSAHIAFTKQLAKYKQGKGSVQFPFDKPIPYSLIKKMAAFKAGEITRLFKT
jgi:uncharacterized protein YdhG (YjbR/CyaY superfamily)